MGKQGNDRGRSGGGGEREEEERKGEKRRRGKGRRGRKRRVVSEHPRRSNAKQTHTHPIHPKVICFKDKI